MAPGNYEKRVVISNPVNNDVAGELMKIGVSIINEPACQSFLFKTQEDSEAYTILLYYNHNVNSNCSEEYYSYVGKVRFYREKIEEIGLARMAQAFAMWLACKADWIWYIRY